jgi:C1A family cysteine protease
MSEPYRPTLGWQRDLPDARDFVPDHPEVHEILGRLGPAKGIRERPVTAVDLSDFFAPALDARSLNASSAFACASVVEYFERRVHGRTGRLSAVFLYKVTRKLLHCTGGTGADLRTTLKALSRFGLPPAEYCPNDLSRFDDEPDPILYSYHFTEPFRTIRYVRLDTPNKPGPEILKTAKSFLAAGFPCVFGFRVPSSVTTHPEIPYCPQFEAVQGGQVLVAVGYNDDHRGATTGGKLRVLNPRDPRWGDSGYGWLPYAYVEDQLAADFWTVIREDWLNSEEFTRPGFVGTTDNCRSAKR